LTSFNVFNNCSGDFGGSVATFKRGQGIACSTHMRSGCQLEKAVDELNLTKKIISCHPSSLPLPDHVDCFVALAPPSEFGI
jgi:hypothetical protein